MTSPSIYDEDNLSSATLCALNRFWKEWLKKTQNVFEIKIYLAWCFKIKVCSISKRPGNWDLFGYDLSDH